MTLPDAPEVRKHKPNKQSEEFHFRRQSVEGCRSTVSWACWPTRLLCNLRIVLCFWAQQNLSDAWGRNSLTIWDAAATAQSTRQLCHNPRASSSCREYEREHSTRCLFCAVHNTSSTEGLPTTTKAQCKHYLKRMS